jgi:hypothetical protein
MTSASEFSVQAQMPQACVAKRAGTKKNKPAESAEEKK